MTAPASALDLVGGAAIIGGAVGPGMDMVKLIRRGLPVGAVQFVLDSRRLTLAELDQIVLPRKTLANRRRIGSLTSEQSDRLIRVARVLAAAEETFGNQEKAGAWLRRPTRALVGECPLHLLDTDEGAREVTALLGRIGHGIAA
jgi:putative toxin-antitoxin system antitoxin component (TIGR02293 family)